MLSLGDRLCKSLCFFKNLEYLHVPDTLALKHVDRNTNYQVAKTVTAELIKKWYVAELGDYGFDLFKITKKDLNLKCCNKMLFGGAYGLYKNILDQACKDDGDLVQWNISFLAPCNNASLFIRILSDVKYF